MKILLPLPSISGSEPRAENSVTVLVHFTVAPEQKSAYLEALKQLLEQFEAFPGTIGYKVFKQDEADPVRVTIMQRFASAEAYRSWLASEAFANWERELDKIGPTLEQVQRYSGMEALFAAAEHAQDAPPRWKMCVVLLIAVFPLSLILSVWVGPALAFLPPALGTLITAPVMVVLMTYVLVPALTRVLGNWLQPRR